MSLETNDPIGGTSGLSNGMVNQVAHTNGVVDTQANDPNMMRRPASISSALNGATLWSTGAYAYDGSGNVIKTGNGYYLYDRVSRLIEGRVQDGPTGGGTQKWQSYTYDPFGNIQSIGGTSGRSTPTSSSTNRLSGTGTVYDSAGNLTNWNGNVYEYDRFNQMTRMVSGAEDWRYLYTAGDERFWSFRVGGGGSLWALRDLDGRLLREYEAHTSWSTFKDYIYRGSQLLASSHSNEGARHFHLDHLGTPRLVTAAGSGGDFHTLTPCRVIDTRNQSAPLAAGETRIVQMAGLCGIPSVAAAVSVNISVVNASAPGEMTAFPAGESRPTASAISYPAAIARGNNEILKLGNGALAFFANQSFGSAHLIIDVNGYFTGESGAVVAYHVYYPFGEEATAFNQDTEQMKFTGHERDLASPAGAGDDLDYMHARHCSPLTGRFLSVDNGRPSPNRPQSWNRYSYAISNPIRYVDPNGLEPLEATLLQFFNAFFGTDFSRVNIIGNSRLVPSGYDALTLGRYVFLSEEGAKSYQSRSTEGIELIAHELAHVLQYQGLGPGAFLKLYAQDYLANRLGGQPHGDAYGNIVSEAIASRVEAVMEEFLVKNRDIAEKLEAGGGLTQEDLATISSHLEKAVSLKPGLQFIQGVLVYIQPAQ